MVEKISVVIKKPCEKPIRVLVENTLEALQGLVDGYIQFLPIREGLGCLVNEEGLFRRDLKTNKEPMKWGLIKGAIVYLGTDEDEFTNCPQIKLWEDLV